MSKPFNKLWAENGTKTLIPEVYFEQGFSNVNVNIKATQINYLYYLLTKAANDLDEKIDKAGQVKTVDTIKPDEQGDINLKNDSVIKEMIDAKIKNSIVAWADFDGSDTSVVIKKSFNVKYITKGGVGKYVVAFADTSLIKDIDYVVLTNTTAFKAGFATGNSIINGSTATGATNKTINGVEILTGKTSDGIPLDQAEICIAIIR